LGIAVHEMDEKTAGRAVDAMNLLMKSETEQRHETCPLLVVYFTERENRRGDTLAETLTTPSARAFMMEGVKRSKRRCASRNVSCPRLYSSRSNQ
jgi:hypothetical protein